MEEEKKEKKKSVASIPDNYVSILQLQERWLKEKERKQKQKASVERGVKQQVDRGQRRREDVMTVAESMEARVNPEEKSLGGGSSMHFAVNRCKKEPICVKKEELDVSAVVSNKDEDGGDLREKNKNIPVKDGTRRVFTSKRENAAKEETRFQGRWIIKKRVEEEAETREVKEPERLTNGRGYYRNQRHDWSSKRIIKATTGTMVWVKKGNNDGASGENGV